MKRQNNKNLWLSVSFIAAFLIWTVIVSFVDKKGIGPFGSEVGLAAFNAFVHRLTSVHMTLYTVTDLAGLIPLMFVMAFAVLGLVQWKKRKSFLKVDFSILVLGAFYIVVFGVYALFEVLVINYRPVLIEGVLEASYPSSTTMLAMCVMPTAMIELKNRINNRNVRQIVLWVISLLTAFMVIGRLVSGVHWVSDIIGGALLSIGLVFAYKYIVSRGQNI